MESIYHYLRDRLTPGLENSQYGYARALEDLAKPECRWLDLGCGHSLVPDWLDGFALTPGAAPIGVDGDHDALVAHGGLRGKVRGDVHQLPFLDCTFDLVTANMVVEHIEHPRVLFDELRRVLAPGGRVLAHTPNAVGYTTRLANVIPEAVRPIGAKILQRRAVADVYPTFYRANKQVELGDLLRSSGFEVEQFEFLLSSPQLTRIPPLLVFEMLWLRRLRRPEHRGSRPVLLVVARRIQ